MQIEYLRLIMEAIIINKYRCSREDGNRLHIRTVRTQIELGITTRTLSIKQLSAMDLLRQPIFKEETPYQQARTLIEEAWPKRVLLEDQ